MSCGQTEQIGNKLNASELEYLRQRAAAKCVSDSTKDYSDLINGSNDSIQNLARDANQWTYKTSSNTTLSHDIYVWKRTSTAIYFRIVIKSSSGADRNVYLKWSKVANNDLFKSVQEDECGHSANLDVNSNSSSVTYKDNDQTFKVQDVNTQYKNFKTFTYSSGWPAVFGLLNYSIQKQLYDNSGVATTSTSETFTIATAGAVVQSSTDYKSNLYYPNRIYCLVTSDERNANGITRTFRKYTTTFTDILNASSSAANLTCDSSSDAPTITVGTADQETFTPATEL